MTRKDYIAYVRTRREIAITLKGVVLYAIWRAKDIGRSIGSVAIIIFGLQILYNGFQSDVKGLFALSAIFIFVGLYIYKK